MCGIFGILHIDGDVQDLREKTLAAAKTLRHRGPDWSGVFADENAILAHERLAIVDIEHGAQPIQDGDGRFVLAVNGEIYNHQRLKDRLQTGYEYQTGSDCEVIIPLLAAQGNPALDQLQGMFAFVLLDRETGHFVIGRDHMGIIPLYYGHDDQGQLYVASEMKALMALCTQVQVFPPGHYWDSRDDAPKSYYQRDWMAVSAIEDTPPSLTEIRQALEQAVHDHLMSDVPYGLLLSGGLDSSIVAAIAQKYAARRVEEHDVGKAWWPQLHSFAIGLEGAPDLIAAQQVADALGTIHHNMVFTVQEGLDAVRDVIYHLETYDVTTVRASTPMYLLARKIKAMGIKMVLSGEGADEIFGGYLYFHKAPNATAFHEELVRKLDALHLYDCLRANKAMSAWGIEPRVPFLDKRFLDVAMRVHARHKMCADGRIEKDLLRRAFKGYLPDDLLWRQKEQFSDGVGYSWIDALQDHANASVSDQQMRKAAFRFPVNTPQSKEAYWYRHLFDQHFPLDSAATTVPGGRSVACSTETAIAWDEAFAKNADPSGRAVVGVHDSPGS